METTNQIPKGKQANQQSDKPIDLTRLLLELQFQETTDLLEKFNKSFSMNDLIEDSKTFRKTHHVLKNECSA